MTVTATKIDSSNESGKNVITWAWPASTTIIYNNPTELTTSNNTFFNLEQCCEIQIERMFQNENLFPIYCYKAFQLYLYSD
jgi:hypothetical protein